MADHQWASSGRTTETLLGEIQESLEIQRIRAKDRYIGKGCTGERGFRIAPCGFARCETCSENGRDS